VFYPSAPAKPRLQFLTSLSGEDDLRPRRSGFLTFLLGPPPPPMPIIKPYGVTLADDRIYVCDTGTGTIDVMDLRERAFTRFASSGEGKLLVPINLAVDRDGTRYVADSGRNRVLIYDAQGTYLGFLDPGTAMKPTDVAVTSNRVYVADLAEHHVRVYDRQDRRLLLTIPPEGTDGPARLFSPTNLDVGPRGELFVADTGAFQVQQYTAEGRHLRSYGRHGDKPGEFARPKGVAVDREGRVYVVDAAMQVIQVFDAEGQLLLYFGEPNASRVALNLPAGIAIDYDHVDLFREYVARDFEVEYLVLAVNQYGKRKVNVYGFGQRTP